MFTMMILPVLAAAAATGTPAMARTVIDCSQRHAAMLASSEQRPAAIADATVAACSHTLDRLNEVTSHDPEEARRERDTNAALRHSFVARIRELALETVERERRLP